LLQLEVSIELSARVADQAASQGVTVVLDPGPVRPVPAEFYRFTSVITPNETEAEALVGHPIADLGAAAAAAHELVGRGVRAAVIKLGSMGAYWSDGNDAGHVPAFPVNAVDTVAAGDAFNGAMAVAMSEGASLPEAVRWGCAAGALAVTKVGAQDSMPDRAAVAATLGGSPW